METLRKRVLVCMTGISPQVVTETLYALARRADPFVPEHLVLMSTIEGAELARKTLLDSQTGWLWRLCREIGLPLSPESVTLVCLKGRDGEPLADIRSVEENEDAADAILGAIRNITSDPGTEVHVSLSGGRKTMGFYAGYALSLYGRPQDRLSHVLVSPPFEYTPEFFYPAERPGEVLIPLRSGEVADAHAARVTLAEIPVVRLRHALPPPLLEGPGSFTDAVRAAQRSVRPPELVIDLSGRRIRAHDVLIPLPPALLAFLVWLAEARLLRKESLTCPKERPPNKAYAAAYLAVYGRIKGALGGTERTAERLSAGMDKGFFEETLSKLNRILRDALGEDIARHYRIEGSGRRWKSYSLPLSEEDVRFEALPVP